MTISTSVHSPVQAYLEDLLAQCGVLSGGAVADYIPELALADPGSFGICIATTDGQLYEAGDSRERFTIQSMSKPFTYGLALEDQGTDRVMSKVGLEPSGEAFNSISLEPGTGRPMNPMINAGAITSASMVAGVDPQERLSRLLAAYGRYAGRDLDVDLATYESEAGTGHRNRAIGHMLRSFGVLEEDPEPTLDLYFRQCSVSVDCRDLSLMAATLANGGINPVTGARALEPGYVDTVLSVMTTCGMYDAAGNWVEAVGMPAKSGVSGGILAVLPGQVGIGVWSPPLDTWGNSVRGVETCRRISHDHAMHFLRVARSARSAIRSRHDVSSVPSMRLRADAEREVLTEWGPRAAVYELQGDLVFAAIETVVRDIVERSPELELVVVDLRATTALTAPAATMLLELRATLIEAGRELAFVTTLGEPELAKAIAAGPGAGQVRVFADIDGATEWCEETLLDRYSERVITPGPLPLAEVDLCRAMPAELLARFEAMVTRHSFDAGESIITVGDEAEGVFLLADGEVSVSVSGPDGQQRRLCTLLAGTMFGELAAIGHTARTANVVADQPGAYFMLAIDDLATLPERDPELHAVILQSMLSSAYETIGRLTSEVASLARRS